MTMIKIDADNGRVARAIHRLTAIPEFAEFVSWVRGSRDKTREQMETLSGDDLVRAQGASRRLSEILEQIEQASTVLEKIEGRRK